jgi:predicted dithiol-disulfide oxidoreductase (DUF899 family)
MKKKSAAASKKMTKKIQAAELAIYRAKSKLAQLRRKAPREQVSDYRLRAAGTGSEVALSSLFGKKNELILIHNMGASCPYCTLWADGFNGVLHHLENRAAVAFESPNPPKTVKKFAAGRGWRFRLVSSEGSTFRKDMGFESDGSPMPGVSVFVRKGGRIERVSRSFFGPGDNFCSVWDLLDLLPKGAGGWQPKFRY